MTTITYEDFKIGNYPNKYKNTMQTAFLNSQFNKNNAAEVRCDRTFSVISYRTKNK